MVVRKWEKQIHLSPHLWAFFLVTFQACYSGQPSQGGASNTVKTVASTAAVTPEIAISDGFADGFDGDPVDGGVIDTPEKDDVVLPGEEEDASEEDDFAALRVDPLALAEAKVKERENTPGLDFSSQIVNIDEIKDSLDYANFSYGTLLGLMSKERSYFRADLRGAFLDRLSFSNCLDLVLNEVRLDHKTLLPEKCLSSKIVSKLEDYLEKSEDQMKKLSEERNSIKEKYLILIEKTKHTQEQAKKESQKKLSEALLAQYQKLKESAEDVVFGYYSVFNRRSVANEWLRIAGSPAKKKS